MQTSNKYETQNLDAEIFMRPSQQFISDRFKKNEESAAQCSGICHSGSCNTLIDTTDFAAQ